MRVVSHVFHRVHAAGSLSSMSLRPSLPRVVFVPALLLLISVSSCVGPKEGSGTIVVRVVGIRGAEGVSVQNCDGSLVPNEVLKTITVRDEDGEDMARLTVHGRDARTKRAGGDGRRCRFTAVQRVQVEKAVSYQITSSDGDEHVIEWPFEDDNCLHLSGWDTCRHYFDTVQVRLFSRGENQMAEIRSLRRRGYLRLGDMWNLSWKIDRARKYSKQDDFPAPAHVVGTTKLWDLADLEDWRRANAPVSKPSRSEHRVPFGRRTRASAPRLIDA